MRSCKVFILKMRQTERTLPASFATLDSLLAATALHHNLSLVTRNVKDFAGITGLTVLNPWE
jgi:toxin FitB